MITKEQYVYSGKIEGDQPPITLKGKKSGNRSFSNRKNYLQLIF